MILQKLNYKLFLSVAITLFLICGLYSRFTAALPISSLGTSQKSSAGVEAIRQAAYDSIFKPSLVSQALQKRDLAPGFIVLIVICAVVGLGGLAVCIFAR